MKKEVWLPLVILGCSFAGIADAWYLAESALSGSPLSCAIEGLSGCNTVAQSAYSHFFGVPLGVYGVFFYALVFITAAAAIVTAHRKVHVGLHALGTLGLLASIVFLFMQFALIKAFCIYCIASAFLSGIIFIASFWLWKTEPVESILHSEAAHT